MHNERGPQCSGEENRRCHGRVGHPLPHLLGNETSRARFRREARAAARLRHENIVPVFGVADHGDHCFYVMQLIEGHGLNHWVQNTAVDESGDAGPDTEATRAWNRAPRPGSQRKPGTPQCPRPKMRPEGDFCRTVARAGRQVVCALAYAHSRGVLHRDIKPSNLLLDADGKVWVTDFGVAKLSEEANLTQTGDLVGTLRYMPPEQFAGHSDARSDVYSLGATLYELLTSQVPFAEASPHRILQSISAGGPVQPRQLNPEIPRGLEAVVLKAMAAGPDERYQTADALAVDLSRFLKGRIVRARRAGIAVRAWRWSRHNRARIAIGSAVMLLMGVVVLLIAAVARNRGTTLPAPQLEREGPRDGPWAERKGGPRDGPKGRHREGGKGGPHKGPKGGPPPNFGEKFN